MAVVFFGLSANEYLSLHEEIDVRLDLSSLTQFSWVVVGAVFVVVFVVAFVPLLIHLPPPKRRLFLLAGAMFTSATIVLELVGGHYTTVWGAESLKYLLCTGLEEFLEMAAIVVFIHALLTYLVRRRNEVDLTLAIRAHSKERVGAPDRAGRRHRHRVTH